MEKPPSTTVKSVVTVSGWVVVSPLFQLVKEKEAGLSTVPCLLDVSTEPVNRWP